MLEIQIYNYLSNTQHIQHSDKIMGIPGWGGRGGDQISKSKTTKYDLRVNLNRKQSKLINPQQMEQLKV